MQFRERWQAWSRRQKLLSVAALVYAAYAVIGLLVVSPLIQERLVRELAAATGREVSLGDFVFNPVGLAVTATDFRLLDEDGTEFIAFDELYVDFELSSLLRWSWYFDVIELQRPRVQVTQTGARSFNFDDLLRSEAETGNDGAAATSIPPVSIGELQLTDGDFRIRDKSRAQVQELVLDDLNFEILDFSTHSDGDDSNQYALAIAGPDGGRLDWSGRLNLDPLVMDGRLSLTGVALSPFAEFYQDRLRFRLPSGELDIATRYRIDLSQQQPVVQTSEGVVTFSEVLINQPDQDDDTLSLAQLKLSGIAVDSASQSVSAQALEIETLELLARLTPEGLDLASLFLLAERDTSDAAEDTGEQSEADPLLPQEEGADPLASSDTPSSEPDNTTPADTSRPADLARPAPAWRARLDRLNLADTTVTLRDETLAGAASVAVTNIAVDINDLLWGEQGAFNLQGSLEVEDAGVMTLTGTGTLDPLALDLSLSTEALSLLPVEPWLQSQARLDLVSGSASLALGMKIDQQDAGTSVRVGVDGSLDNLELNEQGGLPLLALQSLSVDGLEADIGQQQLVAQSVSVSGMRVVSLVDEQGRHTGDRVTIPVAAPAAVGETPPWLIRVGVVRLADSEVQFTDRSMAAPFSIGLYRLAAELNDLDTGSAAPSKLALTADVDRYAPLSVAGELKLAAADPFGDLGIDLKNYEMTTLTPYTGRYIGYTVSSGQLDFNTRLTLKGTLLDSMTRLRADNFYLGERVDSDEAIKAPIKLGLAVLRNKSGEITLPVKASGDLSDPSVSVSGIILKALGNVLVKAATSPFSVLAGLAGGESLENLAFEPGSARVNTSLREDMTTLAGLLADRPALDLVLAGSWSEADREALAQADLLERVWRSSPWPGLAEALADDSFRSRVRREFSRQTGEDAEQLVAPVADTDAGREQRERDIAERAWTRLLNSALDQVPDARLAALAAERASNVKAALVQEFAVEAGRVFLQAESLADREPVAGVQLSLDLR